MREDIPQEKRRLQELAERAARTGRPCFTDFLSPTEAEWAKSCGRIQGVETQLFGGYCEAERQIACFGAEDTPSFPIAALELLWPHQDAPAHRDVLGSVMGLGVKRQCIGDIVIQSESGYLFTENAISEYIRDSLISAGRIKLQVSLAEALPQLSAPEGVKLRDTVASPRLDAVLGGGFGLSRAKAAELVAAGLAKLRHLPTDRPDARVQEGDAISLRGYGRLVIDQIGEPTKKGRLPIVLTRFGAPGKH